MAKDQHLTGEYTLDLFTVAFKKENFFEVIAEHLKYSYLTLEHEKKFWRKAMQIYRLKGRPPSLGVVQVELRKEEKVKDYIVDIKENEVGDPMSVIDAFQDFIKESKFVEIYESAGELYNRGEDKEAFKVFIKGAEDIHNFSIKDKIFKKVFGDFDARNNERLLSENKRHKVPFFIDKLDEHSNGGPETGEVVLFMAESGLGKSQLLIHYAVQTARKGDKVALFQVEGTEEQVMNRLDAAWTGALYHDMKTGVLSSARQKKIENVLKKVRGEIFVEAFERFGGVTINDVRKSVIELKKKHGDELRLVVIDYLELLSLSDGVNYGPNDERHRQQKIGRFMKELAMEQNVVVATVTQASNLPSELKKDPAFVMTREFLSEDKGKIRPFDFFFTLNQTYDEMRLEDGDGNKCPQIRIFSDKMREYAAGQTCSVVTNFSRARFYDRKRTLDLIADYDPEEDE